MLVKKSGNVSSPREADRKLPWATACHPQHIDRNVEPHGSDLEERNDFVEVLVAKVMGFIVGMIYNNRDCT